MSIKASDWKDLIKKRKVIFEETKTPISMQEIADRTGFTYATVNNHIGKLVQYGYVAITGKERFGQRTRDLFTAITEHYDPEMPDYVKQYLNIEIQKLDSLNNPKPHVMKVSCDDYHTRGYTPKRSSWVASSLQGF